ncbi:MAG: GFA family protein [Pseudomonadota bacterium]
MTETIKGHCLCGAVRLEGDGRPKIEVCHCEMCRHWHGGPALVADFEGGVRITAGEDNIAVYESSEWAERCFCKTCGSTLFYRLKQSRDRFSAQAGLFNLPPGLSIHEEIFVEEQPDYYAFQSDAPRLTGAEVFARFEASQQND